MGLTGRFSLGEVVIFCWTTCRLPSLSLILPIRFGVFELDIEARELRKRGVKVKLQQQPFEVLLLLLQSPGEVSHP